MPCSPSITAAPRSVNFEPNRSVARFRFSSPSTGGWHASVRQPTERCAAQREPPTADQGRLGETASAKIEGKPFDRGLCFEGAVKHRYRFATALGNDFDIVEPDRLVDFGCIAY